MTTNHEVRLAKKKRKISALANIVQVNEEARFATEHIEYQSTHSENNPKEAKRARNDKSYLELSGNADFTLISDEQYKCLKKELNARKKILKNVPKLRLKSVGENAGLDIDITSRTPIFLTDLQNLLLDTMGTSNTPALPRWYHIEKAVRVSHTVVLVVEGISQHQYKSHQTDFYECGRIFDIKLAVQMPLCPERSVMEELILVTSKNLQSTTFKNASTNRMSEQMGIFPINIDLKEDFNTLPLNDKFPRVLLLLSPLQMVDEGYPMPLQGELAARYINYVLTKDVYKNVTPNSPMYAIDCEMCMTTSGVSELTRVSIINEDMTLIYETLVRPMNKITDYLTRYSGITKDMMQNVTKTLSQVQQDIRNLLPSDAILIGQSLNSDLTALRMMHPYVIDTSIIFNISGDRKRKSKLQTLAREFLNETIQDNPMGHDSTEDSCASMKLTKLKLAKGIEFGDAVVKKYKLSQAAYGNSDLSLSQKDRSTLIVTSSLPGQNQSILIKESLKSKDKYKNEFIQVRSNKDVYKNVEHRALEHSLTLAHIRFKITNLDENMLIKEFKELDKSISKIWENIALYGLFVVVFEDTTQVTDGAVLLKIK